MLSRPDTGIIVVAALAFIACVALYLDLRRPRR